MSLGVTTATHRNDVRRVRRGLRFGVRTRPVTLVTPLLAVTSGGRLTSAEQAHAPRLLRGRSTENSETPVSNHRGLAALTANVDPLSCSLSMRYPRASSDRWAAERPSAAPAEAAWM